jgi:hypothetical protein
MIRVDRNPVGRLQRVELNFFHIHIACGGFGSASFPCALNAESRNENYHRGDFLFAGRDTKECPGQLFL